MTQVVGWLVECLVCIGAFLAAHSCTMTRHSHSPSQKYMAGGCEEGKALTVLTQGVYSDDKGSLWDKVWWTMTALLLRYLYLCWCSLLMMNGFVNVFGLIWSVDDLWIDDNKYACDVGFVGLQPMTLHEDEQEWLAALGRAQYFWVPVESRFLCRWGFKNIPSSSPNNSWLEVSILGRKRELLMPSGEQSGYVQSLQAGNVSLAVEAWWQLVLIYHASLLARFELHLCNPIPAIPIWDLQSDNKEMKVSALDARELHDNYYDHGA